MEDNKNSFGFDIGIGSIGAAVAEDNQLKYLGVRLFNQASEAKDSRLARSARRTTARKKWRKKQLRNAFVDFDVIDASEFEKENYERFTSKSKEFETPKDRTVYHLRKRALSEKVSERELYLCLLNMLHARGHFNMEMYDFTNDPITEEAYIREFYKITEPYFMILDSEKKSFEKEILIPLFQGKANKKTFKLVSNNRFVASEEEEAALIETLNLLCNNKAKLAKISEQLVFPKDSMKIDDFRSLDEMDLFFQQCIDLFDMSRISQILDQYSYLCEKAVDEIDAYEKAYVNKGKDNDAWVTKVKELEGITKGKHLRSWRNLQNNYPNGLYLKEAAAILHKQQSYNPKVTDDFIEAVLSIISARIPYYIGPLNESGKNAWLTKNENIEFKYSYEYTQKHSDRKAVDEGKSIQTWMERMISHCTYLPEEYALPRGSVLGETFNILNEMNILKAFDQNGDRYYLTRKDKIEVLDKLFLKKKSVKYEEVAEKLNLQSYGPEKSGTKDPEFNNVFTLYHSIIAIDPSLTFESIMDIFDDVKKLDAIEDRILHLNLYSEELTRKRYFEREYGYDDAKASSFAALKSSSYYSFSRKFLVYVTIDQEGNSVIGKLLEDNQPSYTNEQMTIIHNAVDINGKPLNFVTNKYINKLQKNDGKLDINLIMNDGSPVIPMSRPVVRALNELMKMYSEMLKVYGIPKRVVIETARDFKDHTEGGTLTEKHFKTLEKLYENIEQQVKEKKLYSNTDLADWKDLEEYVEKNSTKIELYLRQNGIDLLTGESINLNNLDEYEIDHILPRGFGDDSKDDKILVSHLANGMKGDRLPLEFIESTDMAGKLKISSSEYEKMVHNLFKTGLISEQKYKRLMLNNADEMERFINQNLVDTRYIIREFISILNAFNQVHGHDTHIVALKSAYTSLYRKAFNMRKDRDFGDQHHAHDAALLLVADKTLSTFYPNYDLRRPGKSDTGSLNTYQGFINTMNKSFGDNEKARQTGKELREFTRYAFNQAYGVSYDDTSSIISQIRRTVPFYSLKVEKNYHGKFFEATILDQTKNNPDAPLAILGVNDGKKVFSGVECAAVDFYKYTNAKGKKVHLSVHIPKVIINSNGQINKEKYLKLIKDYYKVPELIDENGELREEFFRFRAFRNDIIYDTSSYFPVIFNIGSMANKVLEKKFINIFSYNSIYGGKNIVGGGEDIRGKLIKYFGIQTKRNPDGTPFEEIDKTAMLRYTIDEIWKKELDEKIIETLKSKVKNKENIYDFSNTLAYYEILVNRPDYPPTIDGQYSPAINYGRISKYPDAQYVKLKYSILGLRFLQNDNGKLIIQSPKENQGAYSKITKEKFSWHISKYDVE